MAQHICKICGAPLQTEGNVPTATCGKCGTAQTLFMTDDPKLERLFERAEQKRFDGEFEDASKLYEKILEADDTNAEAYWGNLLCTYHVSYEPGESGEDPVVLVDEEMTGTCTGDPNYIRTLQFADDECDAIYKKQAQDINAVLKENRLRIRQPRDCQVFVCANPSSTGAVALAQKVYGYLLDQNISVYYDEQGSLTFEEGVPKGDCALPLEQSQAILCCGSDPTDFQCKEVDQLVAYTDLCKQQGIRKKLIPVCQDVEVSELPHTLIALSPIVIEDDDDLSALMRKVNKYIGKHEENEHEYAELALSNASAKECLEQGFNELSVHKWGDAESQFDEVLIREPYNPYAYLGKLLAELELCSLEELNNSPVPFGDSPNYKKFQELADETLAEEMRKTEKAVADRCSGAPGTVSSQDGSSEDSAPAGETPAAETTQTREPETTGSEPSKTVKLIAGIAAAFAVFGLLAVLIARVVMPEIRYNNAVKLLQEGNVEQAAAQFHELDSYRDSKERLMEILHSQDYLKQLRVGEVVYFGSYEQDNNQDNGTETLEWYVVSKTGDQMTLLTVNAVDCKPFHEQYEPVTWETSTIRTWLNSEFYDSAFREEEKAMILPVEVVTANNSVYGTSGGNSTTDRVYLPSMEEITSFFPTDEERICTATNSALANSSYSDVYWWLRNTGAHSRFVCSVMVSGEINTYGYYVNYGDNYVRPMICVALS